MTGPDAADAAAAAHAADGTVPPGAAAALAELEATFVRVRNAYGALYIARTTGRAPPGQPGGLRSLEAAYLEERARYDAQIERVGPVLDEAALEDEDDRALRNLRATIGWIDELEDLNEPPSEADTSHASPGHTAPPGGPESDLRARTLAQYAAAAATIDLDGERLDRLTVFARLATEPEANVRRRLFESLAPAWRAMDGDGGPTSPYRRLLAGSAERWAVEGSPIEAAAVELGLTAGSLEPMLRAILLTWRRVAGPNLVEPWDYRFAMGAAARRIDEHVPRERLRAINDAHLAGLGADPARLGIEYDIEPWPGRPPVAVAFTFTPELPVIDRGGRVKRPARPWVVAGYAGGGIGNLSELLHESGHAIHDAATRSRPALFDVASDAGGFVEAIADVIGWDANEPAFQARHLGVSSTPREAGLGRYGHVMLDVCWTLFEIELHRSPTRSPNEVWSELTEAGLGIRPHPEWSWWAVRGQLLEAPGYMANYALAAIAAAAIRARIREVRGDWSGGDPGWYAFVSERLLRWGAARPPADVLGEFLGRPLTAAAVLDDLVGLAGEG